MFALSYSEDVPLPWQISWMRTPLLHFEKAHDAAAMTANLAMGAYLKGAQSVLEAWELIADLQPALIELCTGEIYVSPHIPEGEDYDTFAPVARPGR